MVLGVFGIMLVGVLVMVYEVRLVGMVLFGRGGFIVLFGMVLV